MKGSPGPADSQPVIATIRSKYDSMTPAQQTIADFILAQPDRAFKMSISELAGETGTRSESTIVRFYKLLGFSGYHDFKVNLATEIAGSSFYHSYEDITADDDVPAVTRKLFQGAVNTLRDNAAGLSPELMQQVVEVLEQSRRVVLLGYATSAAIAYDAYFKFSAIGLNCHFSTDPHVNAVILSDPQPGDVVFCISNSGETKDVVEPVREVKPLAKVIVLTGNADSQLGEIADVCIATASEERNYRSDAIVSRIVQSTIIGALFASLSVRRGQAGVDRLRRTRHSLSYLKY